MPGVTKQVRDELRGLSEADLRQRVTQLQEEQFRLKFRSATETLEQPLRLRTVRRDIARCLTILRERELAAEGGRPSPKARRRENRRTASGPANKGQRSAPNALKAAKAAKAAKAGRRAAASNAGESATA